MLCLSAQRFMSIYVSQKMDIILSAYIPWTLIKKYDVGDKYVG
jgi:hypothetical protein